MVGKEGHLGHSFKRGGETVIGGLETSMAQGRHKKLFRNKSQMVRWEQMAWG